MNITTLEQLEMDNLHLKQKEIRQKEKDSKLVCNFCHKTTLVECHGHHHCTFCGQANWVCCDGETATN